MNPGEYDERIWIHCGRQYLQLAICRTHTCLSRGYNLRSIGQARVREILEKEKRFSIICICPGSRWKSGWGYYWEEYLPYTVENIAVGINPDIDIWNNYLVLLRLLLISKEGVRHPNFGRVRESEIVEFAWDTNSCQHKLSLRNGGLNGQWLCEYSVSPFLRFKSEIQNENHQLNWWKVITRFNKLKTVCSNLHHMKRKVGKNFRKKG